MRVEETLGYYDLFHITEAAREEIAEWLNMMQERFAASGNPPDYGQAILSLVSAEFAAVSSFSEGQHHDGPVLVDRAHVRSAILKADCFAIGTRSPDRFASGNAKLSDLVAFVGDLEKLQALRGDDADGPMPDSEDELAELLASLLSGHQGYLSENEIRSLGRSMAIWAARWCLNRAPVEEAGDSLRDTLLRHHGLFGMAAATAR